ncbi:unnamed protein product [Ascophyllum nodosum]
MWTLPVVDMEDPSAPAIIGKACKDFGFFYLENHGVPEEVMRYVFDQSKAFFSLDIKEKMKVKADKNNHGYTPMHEEIVDPEHQSKGDTKEGYYVFREIDPDSEEATKPLRGPNQWPCENLLPGWEAAMTDYFDRMHALGLRLTRLLAVGIGLEPSSFEDCFSQPMSVVRLLHYSAEVSDPSNGVLGTGAHSDYGLMTMLATDDVPGLQVLLDGEWHDVPPRPGAFVCNLGDMLQRWTNDHFRSTVHRVVNKLGRERYSIPYFFEPNFDTQVECFPQFCSDKSPAKYPPVTSGMYLIGKYSKTHVDFDVRQRET